MQRFWMPLAATCFAFSLSSDPALSWGNEGHRIVATLAGKILEADSPETLKKVEALLATDTDNELTPKDIASEATWADAFRGSSTQARDLSEQWHFVDIDFDKPDVEAACFQRPKLGKGELASEGPSPDCVIEKIKQFRDELKKTGLAEDEKLLALKFLLHFVGDIHQPLHATSRRDPETGRDDRGANCVGLLRGHATKPTRLHSYWDTDLVVRALKSDVDQAATELMSLVTPKNKQAWASDSPDDWAQESYKLAKTKVYAGVIDQTPVETDFIFKGPFGPDKKCGPSKVYRIAPEYDDRALPIIKEQLAKAAFRLATLLKENLK